MTNPVDLRLEHYAHVAYVLCIEGIPYAYTTDTSGDLWGTSWMLRDSSRQTVKPGLKHPSYRLGSSFETGMLRTNTVRFTILDTDGTLATIFATEGRDRSQLWERVGPSDAITSVTTSDGIDQDLSDKCIGIETMRGSTRRSYAPMHSGNVTFTPFDHPHQGDRHDVVPPVNITDDPDEFTGRVVALYRVYKDVHSTAGGYLDWPSWGLQHGGSGLAWWGKMRDRGSISGNREWSIECWGPESLLKKTINTNTTNEWHPVTAPLTIDDGDESGEPEDRVAIHIMAISLYDHGDWKDFDSKFFQTGAGNVLTGTTRDELVSEMNILLSETLAGTDCDHAGINGSAEDYDDTEASFDDDSINLRKADRNQDRTFIRINITLHEKIWKALGYEPAEQMNIDPAWNDPRQILFKKHDPGEAFDANDTQVGTVPGPRYWTAELTTIGLGVIQSPKSTDYANLWDNNGHTRYYKALYPHATTTLEYRGGQEIGIAGAESAYIEPQLIEAARDNDVDGTAVGANSRRYFMFRGMRRTKIGEDAVPYCQIAQCAIREHENVHGSVYHASIKPMIYLEKWLDPMAFGIKNDPLDGEWASPDWGEEQVRAKPVAVLGGHGSDPNKRTPAISVLLRLMLSTGTAAGWDDHFPDGDFTVGDNSHGETDYPYYLWDDWEIADLGLGIPYELVDTPQSFRKAFDRALGSYSGALAQGKWVIDGPTSSWDLIKSIVQPRRLMWRLHGAKYGIVAAQPPSQSDVDVVITEDDLNTADPPSQDLRATSPFDRVVLTYRYRPDDGTTKDKHEVQAADPLARSRTGDTVLKIKDPGLLAPTWFSRRADRKTMADVTQADDWRQAFRELWAYETANLMAHRHFMVTGLMVSRVKGQDIFPGTRIRLTCPWPVDTDGTYGLTNKVGLVTDVSVNTEKETYTISVLIFAQEAGDGPKYFAPVGRVKAYDPTSYTFTLYDDFLGHGDTDHADSEAYAEPSWSSFGGDAKIRLYHWNRNTWEAGQTGTVSSVNTTENTITLTGALSASYDERDQDTLIVMEAYDDQTAEWVKSLFGVVVLDNLKFGSGPTKGWPYH